MKLKSLLLSAGLTLTLGFCAVAGISASKNASFAKADAYSTTGLTQVTPDNSASFVGCKAYIIGSNTSYGLTNYGNGQFKNSGDLIELTIATGTTGSALKLTKSDGKYLSNPLNGTWSESEATIYVDSNNRLGPSDNTDIYWWVVKYEGVSYYETHQAGAMGSATSYFYLYAEPAPEPVMETLYLDLGKTNWGDKGEKVYVHYWGGASSTTWPGEEMTRDSFGLYTASVDTTSTNLKFHVSENWGGDCETGDLDMDADKLLWTLDAQGTPCSASCQAYELERVYVLDKRNVPLCERQKLHTWRSGYVAGTTFPGIDMTKLSGYIYYADIPSVFDYVKFNEGTQQTADLARVSDPCFVIETDWSGAWTSLKAAQFIDGYMKFATINPADNTDGTACKAGWNDLYTAYTTTYAEDHEKIIAIRDVSARLGAWAAANGVQFNDTTGAFVRISSELSLTRVNADYAIIIIVTSLVLASVGGLLIIIRKKKER